MAPTTREQSRHAEKRKVLKMQIPLRVQLDVAKDRVRVEFEPGAEAGRELVLHKKAQGKDKAGEAMTLQLDKDGYLVALSIPGLAEFLKEFTGADEVR
jgi:hypothetical protein